MQKHSVVITGHRTSLSLETVFWDELKQIAKERKISLAQLIEEVDNTRKGNLSGALRVYVLNTLKQKIIRNEKT